MSKYLDNDVLRERFPYLNFKPECFISSDNYDESLIAKKIEDFGDDAKKLLQQCAISIAVIGAGKGNYGSIRIQDDNVIEIKTIFEKYGVIVNGQKNSILKPDDLTPKRLVRFFRLCTMSYLRENNKSSYLWNKYSDKNVKYKYICFPGAEHFVESKEEFNYLIHTYSKLDHIHGSTFVERLHRVGNARGLTEF